MVKTMTNPMKNPITDEMVEDPQAYVDSLAESYRTVRTEIYQAGQDEAEIIAAMDNLAGESDKELGTFTLKGVVNDATGKQTVIKLERRQNISYPREKGAEHPLRKLMNVFDQILSRIVNVDYKERGAKIQRLIDRVAEGGPHTEEEGMLVAELIKVRVTKAGKPSIEIAEKKVDG